MPIRRLVHPRDFIVEYVEPALQVWSVHQDVTHLAVHAVSQIDILAEVTFNYLVETNGTHHNLPQDFRDDLGFKYPAIGLIRNAHDSHKHGGLKRKTGANFRLGPRPEVATRSGFFVGHTPVDGPLTEYGEMILELDDGSVLSVGHLILEGSRLWHCVLNDLQI